MRGVKGLERSVSIKDSGITFTGQAIQTLHTQTGGYYMFTATRLAENQVI